MSPLDGIDGSTLAISYVNYETSNGNVIHMGKTQPKLSIDEKFISKQD